MSPLVKRYAFVYRKTDIGDALPIGAVISKESWKHPNKPWSHIVDTDKVMTAMAGYIDDLTSIVVDESYVVLYSVDIPWFSSKKLLDVFLVYRVCEKDKSVSMQNVLDTLEEIAKEEGCVGICVGTALAKHDRALTKMYTDDGYNIVGTELIKEIK